MDSARSGNSLTELDELRTWAEKVLGDCQVEVLRTDLLHERESYQVSAGNRVYLLKKYRDRSRFDRELFGCTFAHDIAKIYAPTVRAIDRQARRLLIEFIPGSSLSGMLRLSQAGNSLLPTIAEFGRTMRKLHDTEPRYLHKIPTLSLTIELNKEFHLLNKLRSNICAQISDGRTLQAKICHAIIDLTGRLEAFRNQLRSLSSDLVVNHGDVWSGNVIVSDQIVGLVDFEWACISDPAIDIGRIYARGLVTRDLRRTYQLGPPPHFWEAFCSGYAHPVRTNQNSQQFSAGLVFGLVRTINHYASVIDASPQPARRNQIIRTMGRISRALSSYVQQLT